MIEMLEAIFVPENTAEWMATAFVVTLWIIYIKLEVIDKRVWKENKVFSVVLFVMIYIISLAGYQVVKAIGNTLFL